jgi:hypothetical protein
MRHVNGTKLTVPRIIAGGIQVIRQANGLRIARTSDAIASLLVLAFGILAVPEVFVRNQLQELHTWALSAFSVPHFGQYI